MRVIQQIIEYLAERGELGEEVLRYLRTEGFAPYPTDYTEPESDEDEASPYDDLHPEPARRKSRRRFVVKGKSLSVGQLKARIAAGLGDWAEPLAGLLTLARRFDPTVGLVGAPLTLIQAEPGDLYREVKVAVNRRDPSLKTLWKSLDFTAFHHPGAASGEAFSGGTARAYRFLLKSLNRHDSPGCGWLLRYWQVRWAVQVAEAQRRLLAAMGRLYREEFDLLHRELSRERHDGAFWAYTLLYSANAYAEGRTPGVPTGYGDERAVTVLPPDQEGWLRAWSQALLMEPRTVLPFLRVHGTEIGLQAVTVDKSGQVILWNTRTGNEIQRFVGHGGGVSIALFTPDGRRLLTGSADGTARLWDVSTGQEIVCFDNRNANADPAWCATFSPDGSLLATGSGESGKVYIWEVATGKRLRVFPAHTASTWSLAWSPDGMHLATAGSNGVRLFDPQTGRRVRSLFNGAVATCLAYSQDGAYLAAGASDAWVRLWKRSGEPTRQPGLEYGDAKMLYRHDGYYQCSVQWVTFTADNRRIHSTGDDGQMKAVDIRNYRSEAVTKGHSGPVYCVALSPEEDVWLTTGGDQTARLWDAESAEEVRTFRGHRDTIWCGVFRPGTKGLALVCPTRWDKTF